MAINASSDIYVFCIQFNMVETQLETTDLEDLLASAFAIAPVYIVEKCTKSHTVNVGATEVSGM